MMRIDSDLDPADLKSKAGRKVLYPPAKVVEALVDGMTDKAWKEAAISALDLSPSTFSKVKKIALEQRLVRQDGKAFFRVPKVYSFDVMSGEKSVRDATPMEVNRRKACEEVDRKDAEKAARRAELEAARKAA